LQQNVEPVPVAATQREFIAPPGFRLEMKEAKGPFEGEIEYILHSEKESPGTLEYEIVGEELRKAEEQLRKQGGMFWGEAI